MIKVVDKCFDNVAVMKKTGDGNSAKTVIEITGNQFGFESNSDKLTIEIIGEWELQSFFNLINELSKTHNQE